MAPNLFVYGTWYVDPSKTMYKITIAGRKYRFVCIPEYLSLKAVADSMLCNEVT